MTSDIQNYKFFKLDESQKNTLRLISCKYVPMRTSPTKMTCVRAAIYDELMAVGYNGTHCLKCSLYLEADRDLQIKDFSGEIQLRRGKYSKY